MSKNYFMIEESPYQIGKSVVRPVHENLPLTHTTGSYNLLAARLLNLSYAQYLRMCRDLYGAEIVGKNHRYPVAYFKNGSETAKQLVSLLNKRAEMALKISGGRKI